MADTNWELERLRYHDNVRSLKPSKKRGVIKADGNPGVVIAFAPPDDRIRIRAAILQTGSTILASGTDELGQYFTIVVRTTNFPSVAAIVDASP